MKKLIFRDSTVREGVETPLCSLNAITKLEILKKISDIGVKEVEIQLPNNIDATLEIGKLIKSHSLDLCTTGFLFEWMPITEIEQQIAQLSDVIDRFIIVVPGSKTHMRLRNTNLDEIQSHIIDIIELLHEKNYEVELGIMDAYEMEQNKYERLIRFCSDIDKYVLYDTSGRATPEKVSKKVLFLRNIKPNARIIVHMHNDFGLATINTITGIIHGADGCDTVVNGLGDRSGNAAFEEVVVALEILYGIDTGITMRNVRDLCRFVYEQYNLDQPAIKPICGKNAFCHATDMHIFGALDGASDAFEPFDIKKIGADRNYLFEEGDYSKSLNLLMGAADESRKAEALRELRREGHRLSEVELYNIINKYMR